MSCRTALLVVRYIVPGVISSVSLVVTSQQAVDLGVKEDIRRKTRDTSITRDSGRGLAARTRQHSITFQALQTWLTESVSTRQNLGFVSEAWDLADETSKELVRDLLRVVAWLTVATCHR